MKYHWNYRDANSNAHRKPAPPLGTPCLTRTLGIWKPKNLSRQEWWANLDTLIICFCNTLLEFDYTLYGPDNTAKGSRRFTDVETKELVCTAFDGTHLNLMAGAYRKIGGQILSKPVPENASQPMLVSAKRNNSVILKHEWENSQITINFEPHTEHFVITSSIDLSKSSSPMGDDAKFFYLYQLSELCFNRFSHFSDGSDSSRPPKQRQKFAECYNYLAEEIWKLYEQKFVNNVIKYYCDLKGPTEPSSEIVVESTVGEIFADLRSLSLTIADLKTVTETKKLFRSPGWLATKSRLSTRITDGSEGEIGSLAPKATYTTQDLFDTIWPFIASPNFKESRESEFTVSTLLRKRFLYTTSLGIQPINVTSTQPPPVFFLLLSRNGDKWQNGRLVDRINQVGIFRLAAMWDLNGIISLSDKIKSTEQTIDAAMTKIEISLSDTSTNPQEVQELRRKLLVEMSTLQKESAEIDGGIAYRVERSRYYRKQFDEAVSHLNCERVEGFQPYNEFVPRRLFSTYNFIDMVGQRYESIQRKFARLNRVFQTESIKDQTNEIRKLQETGDLVFYLVVIPYYGGLLFEKITIFILLQLGVHLTPPIYVIYVITFLVGSSIWVYRWFRSKRRKRMAPANAEPER